MAGPKRHHIIPKFYLERFCRDGLLFVYDRERNDYRRQSPINTAVMRDYYTIVDPAGQKDTRIEAALATLEGETKPVLEKLDRRQALIESERGTLALFVALLQTRVPDFERSIDEIMGALGKRIVRESFGDEERARASMEYFQLETGKELKATPAQMAEFVNSDEYTMRTSRAFYLATMLKLAANVAPLLLNMNWAVLHAPRGKSFVTTDSPLIIIAPRETEGGFYGVGIATPGAVKIVPLGSNMALYIGDTGSAFQHVDIHKGNVRGFNCELTRRADDYVFGPDKRLLQSLVKATHLATRLPLSKVQIG